MMLAPAAINVSDTIYISSGSGRRLREPGDASTEGARRRVRRQRPQTGSPACGECG
jgi:hypothetical protein